MPLVPRQSVLARLEDPTDGVRARLATVAAGLGLDASTVPSDFVFEAGWHLSDKMKPATAVAFAVRPRRAAADEQPIVQNGRLTVAQLEIQCAVIGPDPEALDAAVEILAQAVMQCLDGLPKWSQDHGGTIRELGSPTEFTFGSFDDVPTNSGFRAAFTVTDQSPL